MSLLIFLWLSSLAFYQYPILGTLSVDNIGAPLMLLLALGLWRQPHEEYGKSAILLALTVFLPYFVSHLVARGSTLETFVPTLYELSKTALYFVLPIALCTTDSRRRSFFLGLVFISISVNLSNLAATLGLYVPPSERLTVSRLGVEWLPRSVGLFVNYGDQAMVSAIAILIGFGWIRRGKMHFAAFSLMALTVFLGLIASQSRNVALTIAGGIVAFAVIHGVASRSKAVRRVSTTSAGVMLVAGVGLGMFYFSDLVAELTNWGGVQASSTAADRLAQYKFALNALEGNWLLGVDEEFYRRNQLNIDYIHNLWLREVLRSGLPGAASMLGVIGFIVYSAISGLARNFEAVRFRAIAFGICAASGIATQFYIGSGYILWLLLGVCFALVQSKTGTKTQTSLLQDLDRSTQRREPDLLNDRAAARRSHH